MSDINEILGVEKEEVNVAVGNPQNNKIGAVIKAVGWVTLIGGILIGVIVGSSLTVPEPGYTYLTQPDPLSWVYGIAIIISSFISGVLFIGFGEIINLLTGIRNNTAK